MLSGVFPIDRSQCHPVVDDLPQIIHLSARLPQEPSLKAILDLLCHELIHPDLGSCAAIGTLLDTLLVYVLRWWYREHGAGWGSVLNDPAISRVLCAMHNSPGEIRDAPEYGTESRLPLGLAGPLESVRQMPHRFGSSRIEEGSAGSNRMEMSGPPVKPQVRWVTG